MTKKILLVVFIIFTLSCTKHPPQFLEEKPFTDKITPVYFSKTIDTTQEIFLIDETFRKQPITIKDRANFPKYSKIYFDEDFSPVKIENYKKDQFNSHIYYPYLTLKIEKKEGKVAVSITEKTWQNGQLIASSVKMNFFDKESEGDLDSLIEAFRKNADATKFSNLIYKISFVADDTAENRETQTRLAGNMAYLKLTGKENQYKDIKINLFFYVQSQADAAFIPIGQPFALRVRFSKYSASEGIEFTYLGVDTQKTKEPEKKENDDLSKSGANMYKSKNP